MKHITELSVRPYECDSYNHVNNAVYLNYLEFARIDFLNAAGFGYESLISQGYYLFVTHIDIYYKASAVLNDKLFIESYPAKLQHVKGEFHQTIKKADGTICAEADVTWAVVNNAGKPSKLPKEFIVPGLIPEI